MHRPRRTLFVAGVLLTALPVLLPGLIPGLQAQTATDPSGHWEGTLQAPGIESRVEVDLAKNSKGELAGTISIPAQHLIGLPLGKVAVDHTSVTFYAREDQPFTGTLTPDGASMSGSVTLEGFAIPMTFSRTGEPRLEAQSTSAAIGKDLEGTWNGTLDVNGTTLRLVLKMSNHPDGSSTGSLVNLDEGNLEVPLSRIAQAATSVTLELQVVGGSYVGVLGKEGTELVGTYTQGPLTAPLTFRRVAGTENNR
jgi:hypothetical protein